MQKDCSDSRSDGFLHIVSLLGAISHIPQYLLLENVEGFEKSESRERLMTVLKERDYHVQEFILSPNQFGVPNQRDRYFLIARLRAFPEVEDTLPRIHNCLRVIPGNKKCESQLRLTCSCHYIEYKNGTAEMGTKESQELWNSMNASCAPLSSFLDNEVVLGKDITQYRVPRRVLEKSGRILDIVSPTDHYSCCFTKAYRKYQTGTGSVLQTEEPYQQAPICRDVDNLLKLGLRYFTSSEMKRLHGFPESFGFPDEVNENQRAKLVGNSLSVSVVAELLRYLFQLRVC